jgi:murein DD-endopeptidase MepM/ murein hydrolase activator NlpD
MRLKRIIALLLCLVLLCGFFAVPVFAAEAPADEMPTSGQEEIRVRGVELYLQNGKKARNMKLTVGQSVRLQVKILPENATDQNFSFSSDKPSVAYVYASGLVKAKAPGKAVITVTTLDRQRTAKFTVRVLPTVQAIELSATSLEVAVGKRKRLKADIVPSNAVMNGNLVWTTNRPGIATVDAKGYVRGLKPGKAIITVETPDGKVSARCVVTVGNPAGAGFRVFRGRIKVTSPYRSPGRPDHNAIDIVGQDDPRVFATVGGRVRWAREVAPNAPGWGRTWEWGNFVYIEGEDGFMHIYAHMKDTPLVKEGSYIPAGTQLGEMGNTGYSFGIHTHYEVRMPSGETVDPAPFTGLPNEVGIFRR